MTLQLAKFVDCRTDPFKLEHSYEHYEHGCLSRWRVCCLCPASLAATLTDEQLRTNAFFQMTSVNFAQDAALYGSSGSQYAQAVRNRILADAIPARMLPVGANTVDILGADRNFNMDDATMKNGWPQDRLMTDEGDDWHHGDFQDIAYTFTHKLFDSFVNLGNVK